jgi:hypothetical protein
MHAVVVHVTVNELTAAQENLTNEVVPRVSGAPGFVAGYWVAEESNKGIGLIVYDSEGAARAVAEQVQPSGAGGAVTIDSVDVCEVVASA